MLGHGPVRQAVVLAGGRGTRLGALTDATPKPLLPVGGRPFLDWVADNLLRQGVDDLILTVGYRADAFDAWITRWSDRMRVRRFVEETPLGTAGALPLLRGDLRDSFVVLNGDTMYDAPIQALERCRVAAGVPAVLGLRTVPDVARYGEVVLDGSLVTAFREKGRTGPGLINGGVYLLAREAVDRIGSPASIETDLLPVLVAERSLAGLPCDGFFIDIGIPSSFEEAQTSVPEWWATIDG